MGVTRQVVDRLLADRTLAFRRPPSNKRRRFKVVMSCCSPRIVAERERAPFAARCESPPIGRECRSVDRPHELCPSVSLRVFTVREGEGS